MGTFNTQSKVQNNIRIFRNTQMLSDPLFNFKSKFRYPQDLLPIPPTGKTQFTVDKGSQTQTFTFVNAAPNVGNEHPTVLFDGKEKPPQFNFTTPIPSVAGFKITKIELKNVVFKTTYQQGTWAFYTRFKVGEDTIDEIDSIIFNPVSSGQAGNGFDVLIQKNPTLSLYKFSPEYKIGEGEYLADTYYGVAPTLKTTTTNASTVEFLFTDDKAE